MVSWIEEDLGEAGGGQRGSGLPLKRARVVVWGFLHSADTPAAGVWVGEVGVPIWTRGAEPPRGSSRDDCTVASGLGLTSEDLWAAACVPQMLQAPGPDPLLSCSHPLRLENSDL